MTEGIKLEMTLIEDGQRNNWPRCRYVGDGGQCAEHMALGDPYGHCLTHIYARQVRINNIPHILEQKGWSKFKFWRHFGGSQTTVYKHLTSETLDKMHWLTMWRAAKILGVPLEALWTVKEPD